MSWEHGDSNIPDWLAKAGLLEKYISYDEHPEGVSEIRATRSIVPHEVALEKHRLAWDARTKRIIGGMSREESDEIMSREAESWRDVVWFKRKQSWAKLKREAHEFTKQLVREGKTEVPKRSPKLGDVVQLTEEASWAASWRSVRLFGGSWEVGGKDGPAIKALQEVRGIIVAKRKKWYIVVWDEQGFEQLVKRYAKKGRKDRVRGYLGYLPWEVVRGGLKVVSDRSGAYRQKTRAPELYSDMSPERIEAEKKRQREKYAANKPKTPKLAPKLQRAVELLAAGMTAREVAKELGVYDSQVRHWMSYPDFQANMEAQGMKHSSKTGWKAKSNGGSRILYHIGKRPAQPEKKRASWRDVGQDDSDWVRPWLDSPVPKGVFLTSNPILVSLNHGISGHVYAYELPRWVIKKAQGIHRYDRASEVLIPDTLWKHVKFLGKSMEKDKLYEKAARYDDSAYNKHREEEGAKRRKRQWSPSSRAAFLRAEWEDDDGEAKFNPTPQWLPLSVVQPLVAEMEAEGVSEVARSKRGFLTAYERAKGDVRKLGRDPAFGQDWVQRRNNFVKRHMGQILKRGEPLWVNGRPSRRHLALIAWAYSPTEVKLKKYAQAKKNPRKGKRYKSPPYKAKSMRRNPRIKSVGLPLSKGEGVTDSPQQWRKGLVKFQRLVEGLGEDLPTGVWVVAMGFPPFETLDTLGRGGQRGTVKPPLGQYKHSWAALYKDKYTGVWVVEAINYTGYPAGGEASLYPLRLLKDWDDHEILPNSPKLWEHLAQATCAYGMETPFNLKEEQDMVESVKPTLAWADKIIDTPWKTPIFSAVSSPQSRLVWEFDQAKKGAKKNTRKKYGIRQMALETPRDLREQISWRAVEEGSRPDLEEEIQWRGPTKQPFLSLWADGWRKHKARHDWSGLPLVIHFWMSPSGERKWLKIKDSPLERGAVPLKNPRGSDIYDPREEQLRAQRQAIYESSLLRDEPQLKFKSFRNSKGERLDQHIIEEGDFPWLQKYIGKKMFRIGVGVQKRDGRLKRKDGYLSLTAKTIGESKKRYDDVDKLVRNRQDYEESLALMRKSTFYRVTPEPTPEGLKYFVWPMQPGQRLPKGFSSKKRAENVANLANRDAPTVGGAWWKPPKKKYTKRELADWLPPADIWRKQ